MPNRDLNREADLDKVEKRKKPPSWWDRNWLKICLLFLFAWTSLGFYLIGNERSDRVDAVQNFSVELRNGLVASCEKNGNPLREAVQGMLEEEIKQSNPRLLKEFFPQVPPLVLERIIARQTRHKEEVIAEIKPLNCEALYPKITDEEKEASESSPKSKGEKDARPGSDNGNDRSGSKGGPSKSDQSVGETE